jgi:hypothetical protein
MVTVVPEIVQTDGVLLVYVIVSPDVALAAEPPVRFSVPPTF